MSRTLSNQKTVDVSTSVNINFIIYLLTPISLSLTQLHAFPVFLVHILDTHRRWSRKVIIMRVTHV